MYKPKKGRFLSLSIDLASVKSCALRQFFSPNAVFEEAKTSKKQLQRYNALKLYSAHAPGQSFDSDVESEEKAILNQLEAKAASRA